MFRHHDNSRSAEALRLVSVSKTYGTPGHPESRTTALDNVSLSLAAGTFTAVMGPSGSGKSTLLQCAAGLDSLDNGVVVVDGAQMAGRTEAQLTKFRRERIGFIFQQYNLLDTLTVLQNVTLPLRTAGKRPRPGHAEHILTQVGLGNRLDALPSQLSGGQRQRVAVARALVTNPSVIFGDEPTGALDTRSAKNVLELLRETVRNFGQTVVMVTHDPVAASYADSVLFLADGRLAGQLHQPTPSAVAERMAHLGDASLAATAASQDRTLVGV
ncbi:ABC transporter ATP-binding protein [Streptomyces sp. Z26]|uniref:ABC transporter ATP-binding protein n=1 Tax=Streptomyces sp. Z26 TaxID=2500177 RepID=UPI000EF1601B|nr:ABC transporter ATP-binding protein [Streptomyces sp. Z26]RLL70659.1 ABC transporter ATP-binding protein [Streptomyces sp. Z26]